MLLICFCFVEVPFIAGRALKYYDCIIFAPLEGKCLAHSSKIAQTQSKWKCSTCENECFLASFLAILAHFLSISVAALAECSGSLSCWTANFPPSLESFLTSHSFFTSWSFLFYRIAFSKHDTATAMF